MNHAIKYPECPMRNEVGNCSVHGGFCANAVSDEICEALHQAYNKGFRNGAKQIVTYLISVITLTDKSD